MDRVLVKEASYEYNTLRDVIHDLLDKIDGGLVKQGSKVLIKPNFLAASRPEQAITTHPFVIKAIVEYVDKKGAFSQVSDSPGGSKFEKVIAAQNLAEELKNYKAEIKEFKLVKKIAQAGNYPALELASDAIDADVVINVPKLKTHSQMLLSLAVKNLFGCVVGFEKPSWHYKIGENNERFAELLVTIASTIKPEINILDGILAMEGNGPGAAGRPRPVGVIMASNSPYAIDYAVCELVGIKPISLLTNKVAFKKGLLDRVEIIGEMKKVKNFLLPQTISIMFGPKFTHKFMRRNIATRPAQRRDKCRLCNECVKICPAGVIENTGKLLNFNYDKCIRCYCCLEICPHAAIKIEEPIMAKVIRRFYKK